jgi:hypothetical protein
MTSTTRRRLAIGALVLAALAGGAAAYVVWKLPSDDELAARVVREFGERTGVELRIGHLHWSVWPRPGLVVEDVATVQEEPIRVRRASAVVPWSAVFARELRLESIEAEGIAAPRASVRAFRGKGGAGVSETTGAWKMADVPVERARFTDLTRIDRRGIALRYDGAVEFDAHWRPRTAEASRRDVTPPARLGIEREDASVDRWRISIDVAGGTWNGTSTLETKPDGRLSLRAELAPLSIDLELLMQAFGRGTPVAGTLGGHTTLDATGETVSELWRNLRTRTRFSVKPATLTRFDLARADARRWTSSPA